MVTYYFCKVALHLFIKSKLLQTLKRIENLTLHVGMAKQCQEYYHDMWKHKLSDYYGKCGNVSLLHYINFFHDMWKHELFLTSTGNVEMLCAYCLLFP